jgi:imidazolonepropionase-like amidohydrolase
MKQIRLASLLAAAVSIVLVPPGEATGQAPSATSELDMTTWSIVALDPETGDVGISMASCVANTFVDAVGALVPGHGVVATQAAWNLENRNRAYAALREGLGAQETVDLVVAEDTSTLRRQYGAVTMKDGIPEVAGFTGEGTSDWAGVLADRGMAVSAQGNTLMGERVVGDALEAFVADDPTGRNTLADRLMRALEAGSRAGGDVRCNRDGITSTAATAMILVARAGDPPYAASDINVTDQGTESAPWLAISQHAPIEGPNPIEEVRRRFDDWRNAQAELVPAATVQRLSPAVREFVSVSAPHVVVRGVRLIDGTGAPARDAMSVELREGRIARVGPMDEVGTPSGAEVVDGAGHTLIPGLVMLHEHLFYPSGMARYNTNEHSFPPLYLAGGVTTMRTGGSVDPYTDLRVRQHIEEGRIPGPHLDVTGPYLEGANGFVRAMPQLTTPEQARAHVNFWMDQGVTSFKAYNLIDRATLRTAIEAAHARGAKVTGHLCSITYREAADLGIDNLEHGFFAATDWVPGKEPDVCPRGAGGTYLDLDLASPAFTELVDHLVGKGVALTSTLTVVERRAPDREAPPVGAQEAMLPQLHERVMAGLARAGRPDNTGGALLAKYMAMEKAFYDAGGMLVVGTDPTGGGDVVPGYANQRALQLLVEMGLTPEQAVEVATRNGARYLERDSEIGTIVEGMRADLVLLRGDPTEDVGAFRNTVLVFKDGVGFDSQKLFGSVKGWVGVR